MALDRHHRVFAAMLEGPTPSVTSIDAFLADLRRDYAADDLIAAVKKFRVSMAEAEALRQHAAISGMS